MQWKWYCCPFFSLVINALPYSFANTPDLNITGRNWIWTLMG